jgi:hypothetical protein
MIDLSLSLREGEYGLAERNLSTLWKITPEVPLNLFGQYPFG